MNFEKIMIALDLSPLDENLVKYSGAIAQNFGVKTALFVHVVPYLIRPKLLHEGLLALIGKEPNILDRVEHRLAQEIQPGFKTVRDVGVQCVAREGHPQEELLQLVEEYDPDILILGKKQVSGGSGVIARRVARKAKSAIWFVPEVATLELRSILVAVDFSPHSLQALRTALDIKAAVEDVTINVLHAVDVPVSGHEMKQHQPTIIDALKKSATTEFMHFTDTNGINRADMRLELPINYTVDVTHHLKEAVVRNKSDLIIIGAKGHSRLENFLFGSVTEKLVTYEYSTPILVVR